jgi:hypothetical protein
LATNATNQSNAIQAKKANSFTVSQPRDRPRKQDEVEEKLPKLADGSEWMIDNEDGAAFIAGSEGHRIDISSYKPQCLVVTVDEEAAGIVDARDALAIIDKYNLDPFRTASRKLATLLRQNLAPIRHAIPGETYDGIVAAIEEIEWQ